MTTLVVIRKKAHDLEIQRKKLDANIQHTIENAGTIEDLLNALAELGELFAEQEDALVELAGLIEEGGN